MDPGFHQYLVGRKVPDKVLKALKKEAVTNEQTLKVMKDSDLESLKKKYKLPVGQLVLLREARDELIRRAQASAISRKDGSFEVLDLNPGPRPGDVEREYAQRDTVPLLTPSPDQQHQARREKRRLRAEEIRDKYKLPSRSDRYSRLKGGGNGASAVSSSSASPSPVPQPERLHSPACTEGLAATSQMRELYRKGEERGEKISALEIKSHGLVAGAMDYERRCAELAEQQRSGKKKKKKDKKDKSSTMKPPELSREDPHIKSTPSAQQSQHHHLSYSTPTHSRLHHHHQSPSHTPSPYPPPPPPGLHSDPIRPSSRTSYGTMREEPPPRPTTPTSMSYTSEDEGLHPHYDNEQQQQTQGTSVWSKLCCCYRTKTLH